MLDTKSAEVNGESSADVSEPRISPFQSCKEYGPNQMMQLWLITHILAAGCYRG